MPTAEEDRRLLADHKRAVRLNAPNDAEHAAKLARRLVDEVLPYAGLKVSGEALSAAAWLEELAADVRRQIEEENEPDPTTTD